MKRYVAVLAAAVLAISVWFVVHTPRHKLDPVHQGRTASDSHESRDSPATPSQVFEAQDTDLDSSPADKLDGLLTVHILGLLPQGKIRLALFQQAEGFPDKDHAMRLVSADAVGLTAEVVFQDLASGVYALAVFHDLDDDGVLDKNPFGLPTEPYGFSNEARGKFGPPSYADASFEFSGEATEVRVTLK